MMKERLANINEYTPAIQQYIRLSTENPDCILFFRLGDFYEMYFEDAEIASRELEISLTSKGCGSGRKASMAGMPYHAYEPYLYKLVDKGYKVAIVEQLQNPKEVKGLVERGVVRVVSKGTLNEGFSLSEKENNFLCGISISQNMYDITFVDISTGEIFIGKDLLENDIINEVLSTKPSELILSNELSQKKEFKSIETTLNTIFSIYEKKDANDFIANSFGDFMGVNSLHLAFNYIQETQKRTLNHFTEITDLFSKQYMQLDHFTIKNLELVESLQEKKKKGSLLWVLDKTVTAAGGRLLKQWLQKPLISKKHIEERLDAVDTFHQNTILIDDIREVLKNVYDLERIISKLSYGTINPKDMISLKKSLQSIPPIKELLSSVDNSFIRAISNRLSDMQELTTLLENAIVENPPISVREGGIFKEGYHSNLDNLKSLKANGKEWLMNFEEREKSSTGISTLKVSYTKNFGYYIEVSKKQSGNVPTHYNRLQTLVNAERYTTEELVEKADDILNSEDRVKELEYSLFVSIRNEIEKHIVWIKQTSQLLSTIDVLTSLAYIAVENNYVKPLISNDKQSLSLKDNRHPVAEKIMDSFIANDIDLNNNHNIMLITGPNASGKSTYMKSIALSVLMAQIGSFIPAASGTIHVVDRIFTRIGASDDILNASSTFMVEMTEINQALQNGTEDSLIIIDELGRGTSTAEGIAIAKSVIQYIHNRIDARSLIATHYHELTELEISLPKLENYSMKVYEDKDNVVFLHKMERGKAGKSYGVYVAKLCHLPNEIISNANDILSGDINVSPSILEKKKEVIETPIVETIKDEIVEVKETPYNDMTEINHKLDLILKSLKNDKKHTKQLDLFLQDEDNEIVKQLKSIDTMHITPFEALTILSNLKKMV